MGTTVVACLQDLGKCRGLTVPGGIKDQAVQCLKGDAVLTEAYVAEEKAQALCSDNTSRGQGQACMQDQGDGRSSPAASALASLIREAAVLSPCEPS